ncbi:hypothetical protein PIB30_007707 [Stylosanthes scabra]|uniref:Uncharacterized protein n=1 Tax=Stylosanthes scabra TaxID=79078 RepID=A0ABU6X4P9_9FABA|nr:hypothetical protein [Stylosanthes scabra]
MAYFHSDAPLMFRNTRVSTLHELKQSIVPRGLARTDMCVSRSRCIGGLCKTGFMEFLAEVRHVGGSGGFRPYQLPAVPSPINIVPPDYNSDEDSDYDDESSSHSTDEDEQVPNTPATGGPRLVFPAPKPIPALTDVSNFFQQLYIDVRHVEDPSMESVAVEYNTDGGVEFTVGHRIPTVNVNVKVSHVK